MTVRWLHSGESSEPAEMWLRRLLIRESKVCSMDRLYHYSRLLDRYMRSFESSGLKASAEVIHFIRLREIEGIGKAQPPQQGDGSGEQADGGAA